MGVVNLVLWTVTLLFPLRSSVVPLAVGMYIYMLLVPYAEAAEQTILQKVVPYERQGRVFGFAQSVELNQPGPWMPTLHSTLLTKPYSGCSR